MIIRVFIIVGWYYNAILRDLIYAISRWAVDNFIKVLNICWTNIFIVLNDCRNSVFINGIQWYTGFTYLRIAVEWRITITYIRIVIWKYTKSFFIGTCINVIIKIPNWLYWLFFKKYRKLGLLIDTNRISDLTHTIDYFCLLEIIVWTHAFKVIITYANKFQTSF